MKLQQFAQASNSRQAFKFVQHNSLENPRVKCASKTIKKAEKVSHARNSKQLKADHFSRIVAVATQETSNASQPSMAKTSICNDVRMLLSLNKYAPSLLLQRQPHSNLIRKITKQSVKKPEITKKPKLIISIALLEENSRPLQAVHENSHCASKKSLTVSINLEEKYDQI